MRHAIAATIFMVIFFMSTGDAFSVNWYEDFDKAMAESKASGKPVMLDFYTQWCTWCKKLETDTFMNIEVASLSDQFVCAKIDADKNRPLVVKYTVRGYPTVVFLNPNGETSKIVSGYLPPEQFSGAMKFALARAGRPVEPTKILTKIVEPVFKLTGIVLGQNTAKAMINGVSVVEGDVIEGARVVHITAERVVLMAQGRKISVNVDKK